MFFRMRNVAVTSLVVGMSIFSYPSFGVNEAECSIWLCLPSGFPSGCGEAKSAMKKRIKKGKDPLPDFGSCLIKDTLGGDSGGTDSWGQRSGIAAYIPDQVKCTQWRYQQESSKNGTGKRVCVKTETIQAHYVDGTSCTRYNGNGGSIWKPQGCTKTVRWVEVHNNGVVHGDRYYW